MSKYNFLIQQAKQKIIRLQKQIRELEAAKLKAARPKINRTERLFKLKMTEFGFFVEDHTHVGYGTPDFKLTAANGMVFWVELKGYRTSLSECQKKRFASGEFGEVVILRGSLKQMVCECLSRQYQSSYLLLPMAA